MRRAKANSGRLPKLEYWIVLAGARLFGISVVTRYLRNPNPCLTVRLLRQFGASIGEGTRFKGAVILDNVWQDLSSAGDFSHLSVGHNCYVGEDVFFDLADRITIDDNAVIAGRASFITHTDCNRSAFLNQVFPRASGPINVGRGCWIGFGAVILYGISISGDSVVGACALVTKSVPQQTIVAGIPARVVRSVV